MILTTVFFFAAAAEASAQIKKVPVVKCSGKNGLTAAEITELLASQNQLRSEQKLAPFTWDCKLAAAAQEWAARGVFVHRENINFGENMFVSSNTAEPAASAVAKWSGERAFWTNKTATCQTGKICTHYTQIVWKNSTQVGCGINRNGTVKWKTMLVCNYNPIGNTGGPAY